LNAIDLLKQQHREVEELFAQAEDADGEAKRELANTIADKLAVHVAIEEKYFYPATRTTRTERLLREAVEEHLSAKRLLADLIETDPEDPQFDAKVKVLKEQFQHHVDEEENELFPKVLKLISTQELEDLAVVMQDTAEELEQGEPREIIPLETRAPSSIE
jgi:hemerythrin-like domain-containing protein